eukprot:gene5003-6229_t
MIQMTFSTSTNNNNKPKKPIWVWIILVAALFSMSSAATALKILKETPPLLKASWRLQSTSFILFIGFLSDLYSLYYMVLPFRIPSPKPIIKSILQHLISILPVSIKKRLKLYGHQSEFSSDEEGDLTENIEEEDPNVKIDEIKKKLFTVKTMLWLFGTGIILGLHFAFWVMSLDKTSLTHSLLFVTSTPLMVVIVMLCLRKPISKGEILGCLIGFLGLIVTVFDSLFLKSNDNSLEKATLFGDFLALVGAACVVFYFFAGATLRTWLPLFLYAFPVTFIGSLFLTISSLIFEDPPTPQPGQSFGIFGWMCPDFVLVVLYLAFFPGFVGHTGVNAILKYVEPEPPLGSIMGWIVGVSTLPGMFTYIGGPIILAGFLIVAVNSQTSSIPTYSIVLKNPGGFVVYSGNDTNSIAQAAYTNQMMSTGWGYIAITTNPSFEDSIQASAAGYIEGYLSQEMIWQTWLNMYVNEYNNQPIPDVVLNWANDNIDYVNQQVNDNPSDPYWIHMSLIFTQLSSMADGYNDATQDPNQKLSFLEFVLMNMDGDMGDISTALNISVGSTYKSSLSWRPLIKKNEHCSGLIKLTDDLTELYAAHTSWSSYFEMLRMFKSYNFKYSTTAHSHLVMFSGYPATLASEDDFYILDSRLVVLETTNGLNNNNLYNLITPQSVLTWMRAIVANRMAKDGPSWCKTFALQNSGTYNNQWMIVDYKKFIPGVKLGDGTLYVLEQIPNYVEYADVTNILRTGYWPSYNVPYFENIFNMSGFNDTGSSDYEPYEQDPRGQIFRRDANKVYSLSDFQAIMRYNDFQNDPLSQGDAANQISSRFDLNPVTAQDYDAFGGIDSKVTSLSLLNQMIVVAQSGPTHDQQVPFSWSSANWTLEYPTVGMPDTYNFPWITFTDTSFSTTIPN